MGDYFENFINKLDYCGESAFKFLILIKRKLDSFHSVTTNILILAISGKFLSVIHENEKIQKDLITSTKLLF